MTEVWAPVDEFPNYAVSSFGRVVNATNDRYLKPRTSSDGYLKVALGGADGTKDRYIHRLVAAAFFTDFRDGMHVSHVNGDKTNNKTNNLRVRGGRQPVVAKSTRPYYGWGKRVMLVETAQIFRTVRDCANYIGGDYSAIYACLRGERSKHLGYTFEYYEE